MRTFLLFFLIGFWLRTSAQERGFLVAGVNAFPGDNVILGGKLAYYQRFSSGLYGVKVALESDALLAGKLDHRYTASGLDLVRRWQLGDHAKNRLWFDTGISLYESIDMQPPYSIYYCGTGLTDEDIRRIEAEWGKWQIEKIYYPGIALSVDYEFRLTRSFYLGFDLVTNLYYSIRERTFYPSFDPTISWTTALWSAKKDKRLKR